MLALGGGLDYFLKTVLNYPTLAECYKVAAFNAANKLQYARSASVVVSAKPSREQCRSGRNEVLDMLFHGLVDVRR